LAFRTPGKRGFALPLVLAMVAILAIALLAGLSALASLRDETRATLASADFDLTAADAEARLEYYLLTEPLGMKGIRIGGTRAISAIGSPTADPTGYNDYLTYLVADGRPYRWTPTDDDTAPQFQIALQDEGGLVNLNQADVNQDSRVFQQAGLDQDSADQIATELLDYDAQPPPHEPIKKLAELYSLPSGRMLISDKTFRRLDGLAAAHPDTNRININTAPREVLQAWFELSDSQLDQALKDRDDSEIGLLSPSAIGAQVQGPNLRFIFPNGRMRFTFTDPKTKLSYRATLVITPNNQERPIWVENARTSRLAAAPDPLADDAEDFPQIAPGDS
jgi:type II secretory pathway component PulK